MDTKLDNRKASLSCTIFGSSGLIGSKLREELAADPGFSKILLPNRREVDFGADSKMVERLVDFEKLDQYEDLFKVDVIFVCLGTTMKQAGSKEAFQKVDKHLVHQIAKLAKANQCPKLLMISSLGADSGSSNFYLKTKGEAEECVQKDGPEDLIILRPALLIGEREQLRLGEKLAQWIMPVIAFLMIGGLKKYRPIKAETVAKALRKLSKAKTEERIYETVEIKSIAGQKA